MSRSVSSSFAGFALIGTVVACGSRLPPEATPGETPAPDVAPIITSRAEPMPVASGSAAEVVAPAPDEAVASASAAPAVSASPSATP
ncbi:MAG: hypothetical protein JW751_15880 [Polyangiaceae bacterium]|nr:hypothetical protein [Polyangiaceae bacterium]